MSHSDYEELLSGEDLSRNIISSSPMGMYFYQLNDKDDLILIGRNPAADRITGRDTSSLIGKKIHEVFPNIMETDMVTHWKKAALEGTTWETTDLYYEDRNISGAYDIIVFQTAPRRILVMFSDITEKKITEQQLLMSEQKYRQIFQNIQDVYFELGLDNKILEVSPSVIKVSKYRREELIGQSFDFLANDQQLKGEFLQKLKESGELSDYDIHLRDKDGQTVLCAVNVKIETSSEGKPEKIIGSLRDISERKEFELQLKSAKEKAEESDRLKSAFLANMSHEIRTPMNAILGFSELLQSENLSNESRIEYLKLINTKGHDLMMIISDLIDISRIESGDLRVYNEKICLNKFILDLFSQFDKELELKNKTDLELKLRYPAQLETYIYSDKNRLRQVFTNLFANAIKFTESGHIEIGYELKGKEVKFFLKDTGIGIDRNDHDIIFQRFRQADESYSRRFGGTGLGLAICKQIIELLGGRIWVESEPGKGAAFYFTQEVLESAEQAELVAFQMPDNLLSGEANLSGKTLLIAEDDDSNFLFLKSLLLPVGVKIFRAGDGQEAVKIYSRESIDLIIMDIRMPELNGLEAAREIRKEDTDIPIIALTAFAFPYDKMKSKEAGCNEHLSKPIKVDHLMGLLYKYLVPVSNSQSG